jgi:hypothetical protein
MRDDRRWRGSANNGAPEVAAGLQRIGDLLRGRRRHASMLIGRELVVRR